MNQIETRRWRDSVDLARSAASAPDDDFGYLEPRKPRSERAGLLGSLLSAWRGRLRARRALARIPARDLKDAGLSLDAVQHELAQPFWRALNRERK